MCYWSLILLWDDVTFHPQATSVGVSGDLLSSWLLQVSSHLDQSRYDHLNRLVDDSEAVGVVQTHDVGSHEGEDGHDVVQDFFLEDEDETDYQMFFGGDKDVQTNSSCGFFVILCKAITPWTSKAPYLSEIHV